MGSDNLPHLMIEDEPDKRSKKALFGIAVLSFLLLALPITLFLVQTNQQLFSKAATPVAPAFEKSIRLSTNGTTFGVGQQVPIDVVIRTDNEYANLASVVIRFDPEVVKVSEVITNPSQGGSSVFFGKYWLSKGFDNDQGMINLISGTPKPGVKTDPSDSSPLLLAQIHFMAVGEGDANITVDPASAIYDNSTNSPETTSDGGLRLAIHSDASLPTGQKTATADANLVGRFSELAQSNQDQKVLLTSPFAGQVFFYFRPVDINWTASADVVKSITLLLNNEPFGVIAQNIPNSGHYVWTPSTSVPVPMVTSVNTYSLQITASTKQGDIQSTSILPFGLISNPEGKITATDSAQFKTPDNPQIADASKIFSNWGSELNTDSPLDLNGDWNINYLDFYLLRKALFVKDLVF